jgi:hypothetical protein
VILINQTIEILVWTVTGLALAFTLYALNDFLLGMIKSVWDAFR